ncbi:hypothetical protein [Sphingobium phenoxybenzoativorans]|uniref:hypothetical protein n=1 Tax=Sphingobium phenoxybenzoativorans TaxID=1592790 RepID=UPI000871F6E9|nr:hypothetical protein [Sphingobium phenoxybenzoativorans]
MGDRRARLAVSFADLCLLLLGFFVLLQASGDRSKAVLQGVGEQFGATYAAPKTDLAQWRAADLFEPGEAVLTAAGNARIFKAGQHFAKGEGKVELTSAGQDRIGQNGAIRRFDAWDLAAARLGAVARTLKSAGVPDRKLIIRGLDQAAGEGKGQVIRLGFSPAASQ